MKPRLERCRPALYSSPRSSPGAAGSDALAIPRTGLADEGSVSGSAGAMKVKVSVWPFLTRTTVTSSPAAPLSACLKSGRPLPGTPESATPVISAPLLALNPTEPNSLQSLQGLGDNEGSSEARQDAGIAKFTFCASVLLQEVTPITSPLPLTRGPPLLPPEMGQEIWYWLMPSTFRIWLIRPSAMLNSYPLGAPMT